MRDLLIVAEFTIKDMIKRKSFIISNIIILILIVIGFNIPNIIKAIKGNEGEESKVLIVDNQNTYENTLSNIDNLKLKYKFEISNENLEYDNIKQKIEKGNIESAIVIHNSNEGINVQYIVKNLAMVTEPPADIVNALSNMYINLKTSKLNLTNEQLQSISPKFNFELKQTEDKEVSGNIYVIMLLSIVLFYAIYFCAYQVSSSITTEKTSRIIETLITSVTPKNIVLGKTLGIGIIGILQILLIIIVSLISANAFLEDGMLSSILDLSKITPQLGILTIIYFILGYSVYALLYALTGSTVSKPEDINSANSPIAILAVIGFYLSYFTMMNPTSNINIFASIFPISSPFCMPFRVMMGVATSTEILASIAVLVITIIIIAQISIKIYSSAILNTGTKLNIKDILKLYKNK